ncbi:MAG TPA: pyridoxal-phosphate dependent enzyme [Solirubrobacteraceae bacterium]|nr:pyridoxal-phosphate dependent enzyme [Solirubrobacteraceae bacterium]
MSADVAQTDLSLERIAAAVSAFVSPAVPADKVARVRALGADVAVSPQPGRDAQAYVAAGAGRLLVLDGQAPQMAEGAGTIALELEAARPLDLAVVQVGDGALISGIARPLKASTPGVSPADAGPADGLPATS